jgi:DNA-binding NarL/FixJ family response regulator
VRVIILEDNPILAEGLSLLLDNSGFQVAAITTDADQFAKAIAEHEVDIAIVDVRLPPTFTDVAEHEVDIAIVDVRLPPTFTDEGLRAAIEARRVRPGLPVLVFSQYVEEVYAAELLAAGPEGVGTS